MPINPQIQMAYQAVLQTDMQAAWKPYAQTANRYGAGTTAQGPYTPAIANSIDGPVCRIGRIGRMVQVIAVGGQCALIESTGGSGYVANDTVTFAPLNGGRPVKIKITHVTAGAPDAWQILDPGSGFVAGGDGKNNYFSTGPLPLLALNQASTSGVGTGATWSGAGGVGGQICQQPLSTA
jgi:hypothetical protein